jgi:methyl-accepting chemotaxis protein
MIQMLQQGTHETVNSIEQGVGEVEKGKEVAARAGESMHKIEEASSNAMDLVTQVATASEEQSATAEQISRSIEGINNVAQETAIGVEQIAKASEDLNRLTENLQQLVFQFRFEATKRDNGYYVESHDDVKRLN